MTISQRFSYILLVLFLGISIMVCLYIYMMERVYETINFSNTNVIPSMIVLNDTEGEFGRLRVRIYRHSLNQNRREMESVEKSVMQSLNSIKKSLVEYELYLANDKDRFLLIKDNTAFHEYEKEINRVLELSKSNRDSEALINLNKLMPSAEKFNDSLHAHIEFNKSLSIEKAQEAHSSKIKAIWMSILIGISIMAMFFAFGFFIARGLARAMKESVNVATRIAAGDLSSIIKVHGDDETVQMLESLKTMQESLVEVTAEFRNLVDAAAQRGDFSVKLNIHGKIGFIKDISEQLNNLSNITESGLKDVTRLAIAVSKGDLKQAVATEYPGSFGEMVDSLKIMQVVSQELEDRRWAKEQIMVLLQSAQRAKTIDEFGNLLLLNLCPIINSVQGIFYSDEDGLGVHKPISGYGRSIEGVAKFALGEGLLGQCVEI